MVKGPNKSIQLKKMSFHLPLVSPRGSVCFEVFTLWQHGSVAANKTLPIFCRGSVAANPNVTPNNPYSVHRASPLYL